MNIKILGTKGCRNCDDLYNRIFDVINANNYNVNVEKITSILEIANYKVKEMPGLIIDDKLVLEGIVPSKENLKELIESGKVSGNIENEATCKDGVCRF